MANEKIDDLKKRIAELEKEIQKSETTKKKDKKTKAFIPERTLISWNSPSRVFIQRDKVWFLKIAIISLLFILFFAFLQDIIVILVICVVVLISFLLGSIPPNTVTHKITNKGIFSIDQLYKWKDLKSFQIANKSGNRLLYVNTKVPFAKKIMIIIHRKDEKQIVKALAKHINYFELDEKQGKLSKIIYGEFIDPKKYHRIIFPDKPKKKSKSSKKK